MVLKICETKNNVWKKYELSIQNDIDNCTEIIKIKPDFASLSDSSDEVDTFGTGIYECRKLEDHDWDNYLENNYDVTNILAYHWKEKGKDERAISSFSKLIRISTASTNMKVIVTYVLVVVLLGAFGSGVMELIKFLFAH